MEHRVRTRRLIRVLHGVYAVGHVHGGQVVRWMACVLASGDHAALSHVSGLAHWRSAAPWPRRFT